MKHLVLLALAGLALSLEMVQTRDLNSLEWDLYKKQHGKVYGPEEDSQRFARFLVAKERVEKHNADKGTTYKLGLNHMSDWSEMELEALRGPKYDVESHFKRIGSLQDHETLQSILNSTKPLPQKVDWRTVPDRVSPVVAQNACNSSYAIAATGAFEGQQVARNYTKKLVPLSVQDIVDCSENNYGCEGGTMFDAIEDVAAMGGILSDKDYPYAAKQAKCRFDKTKAVMSAKGAINLPNDEDKLKEVVANYGPVAIIMSFSQSYVDYKSGVFRDDYCGAAYTLGALIVGYADDYWIVKNSWGASWGEKGYARIKSGVEMCGIGLISTIPTF